MFKEGDKVRIDLDAWNAWRKEHNLPEYTPAWINGPFIIIRLNSGWTDDGTVHHTIKIGDYCRYCPVNLVRPYVLDKRAISNLLVRM